MNSFDALVIGAGPAGATAALMLARAGWSIALVEKDVFPRRKVCGEFISATSMPLLEQLGIAAEYLAHAGPPVHEVGLYTGTTQLAAAMPRPRHAASPYGRAFSREHLDTSLLRAAERAGAQVWQPWTVKQFSRDADGRFTVRLQGINKHDAMKLRARRVIAAHGSWQGGELPTHLAEAPHRNSDLFAFKAHFVDSALPASLMPLLLFPGGYGGMVNTDGGRTTLSCCIRRDMLAACRRERPNIKAAEAVGAHIRASTRGVAAALGPAALSGNWLAAGPIRPGIRPVYTDGIFVVGNAAGEAHPIVAEGISMAIQSSWLLCNRLLAHKDELESGRAMEMIARAYAVDWRRNFASRVHAAAMFANLATRPAVAKHAVSVLERMPRLLTWGAYLSGKAQIPALAES